MKKTLVGLAVLTFSAYGMDSQNTDKQQVVVSAYSLPDWIGSIPEDFKKDVDAEMQKFNEMNEFTKKLTGIDIAQFLRPVVEQQKLKELVARLEQENEKKRACEQQAQEK